MPFLALAGSVCRQWFVGVMVGVLGVKITCRARLLRIEVLKVYHFFGFVMYYVYMYVTSRPSLLIESVDSMIISGVINAMYSVTDGNNLSAILQGNLFSIASFLQKHVATGRIVDLAS